MKQKHHTTTRPAASAVTGLDVIDLTEFPLGLLSDQPLSDQPLTLEFASKQKEWRVEAHPGYGLPTWADIQVCVCLLELTRQLENPERVPFSRYALIERLGWSHNAERYDRLRLSLDRLQRTTVQAINAYYDDQVQEYYREHVFSLISGYELVNTRRPRAASERGRLPSWFCWAPSVRAHLTAGRVKPLDVDLFLRLERPLSQALYRYLDARQGDGKALYQEHLKTLACQHIGLRQKYLSDVQRKLAPAHEELIQAGFLKSVDYEPMRSAPREVMVVYRFPARRRAVAIGVSAAAVPAAEPEVDALVEQLVAAGLARGVAARLATEQREECERQLGYLPHRAGLKRRAGALRRAIEEAWPAPEGGRRPAPARSAKAARPRTAAARKQEPAREQERAAAEVAEAAFAARWAALSEAERAALTARAMTELVGEGALVTRHFQRHPARLAEALQPLLARLVG